MVPLGALLKLKSRHYTHGCASPRVGFSPRLTDLIQDIGVYEFESSDFIKAYMWAWVGPSHSIDIQVISFHK